MFIRMSQLLVAGLVAGSALVMTARDAEACDNPRLARLIHILQFHPDEDDREDAAEDLGKYGDPSVLPFLWRASQSDRDKDVREEAWDAIERINKRFGARGNRGGPGPVGFAPAPAPVHIAPPMMHRPVEYVAPQPPVYQPAPQPPAFQPMPQPPVYQPAPQPPVYQPAPVPQPQPQYYVPQQPAFQPAPQQPAPVGVAPLPQHMQPGFQPVPAQPAPLPYPAQPGFQGAPTELPPAIGSSSGSAVGAAGTRTVSNTTVNGYRWDAARRVWVLAK